MKRRIDALNNLDQELSLLRSQLEKSFEVIDDLSQIQSQFEELAYSYRQFKQYAADAEAEIRELQQTKSDLKRHVYQLEREIEGNLSEFRNEMLALQDEAQKIIDTLAQTDERFVDSVADVKTLKTDLQLTLRRCQDLGFDVDNLEKIQNFNHQIQELLSYPQQVNSRLDRVTNLVLLAFAMGATAIAINLLSLIF